jgi:SH3 domain-containing YSC84-like protein 1
MRRAMLAAATLLALGARPALAQGDAQALVDRAAITVNEMLGDNAPGVSDATALLRRARAVLICPRIFRAGFIFAGQGGPCTLLARDGAGSWSSPAFYTMGSGSIGLQAGMQDSQVMMLIMNERALNAVLDAQFTLGADAAMTVATIGGGVEGATTGALGADIVTFSRTRGHRAQRLHHRHAQRLQPRILRPRHQRPADRRRDGRAQPGRRPAARRADALQPALSGGRAVVAPLAASLRLPGTRPGGRHAALGRRRRRPCATPPAR